MNPSKDLRRRLAGTSLSDREGITREWRRQQEEKLWRESAGCVGCLLGLVLLAAVAAWGLLF